MEIREYPAFNADEIRRLYRDVAQKVCFKEKQRQGGGTALLEAVLERYPSVRQIQLTTDNTPQATAFYKSMGFTDLSEIGCCGFMKC